MAKFGDGFKTFTLHVEGVHLDTISLDEVGALLADFAQLLGKDAWPRYHSITRGSISMTARVAAQSEMDVKTRAFLLRTGDAPDDAVRARERISRRLGSHRARRATVVDSSKAKVVEIPIERIDSDIVDLPSLSRAGSLQGKVIRLGGRKETVPIDIEDVDGHVYACKASRAIAKRLAAYMFEYTVRVHGTGRWQRADDGIWHVEEFQISDFDPLDDQNLKDAVAELREIDSAWKQQDDALEQLENLRKGNE